MSALALAYDLLFDESRGCAIVKRMKVREGRGQSKKRTIPSFGDSYLVDKALGGEAVCRMCQAIYHNKRWYLKDEVPSKAVGEVHPVAVVCPACRKIRDDFAGGILTLSGEFLEAHKEQILSQVRNEAAMSQKGNPLERIISIKDEKDSVEIHTTNERLAQRIGRALERAYKGKAAYHWSRDGKLARVQWHRNDESDS